MLRAILALSALASIASSQDLDPPEASPFSRATQRLAAPHRILLIGLAGGRPVDVPGVTGAFGLRVFHVDAAGPGSAVSARLRELRRILGSPVLPELQYQILSQDPRTRALSLSDVMRLPLGSSKEAAMVVQTTPPHPPMDDDDITRPKIESVSITLHGEPMQARWTRHLVFTDHRGAEKSVPIHFERSSGLTWTGRLDGDGRDTLRSLADSGNRSYWDDMKLMNKGGRTALSIAHFELTLHYKKNHDYEEDIPIVDSTIDRVLAAGTSSIDLDVCALKTRKRFAGIDRTMPPSLWLAVADLGKSGSDDSDDYGANPKYDGDDNNLCSEFVSWYFHQVGLDVAGEDFRDITTTMQVDRAFQHAGRRYSYHNGSGIWFQRGERYMPQPGDFLARLYDGEYEHAMMVLDWNHETKVMTVINGPWPVTLRYVPIQELEEVGYDFRVGRIP